MDTLLTPDFGLVFWTIVTFLVLVAVLKRYAWKPLLTTIEDRERSIRQAIEEAEKTRVSAADLKAQLEKELAGARDHAQSILVEAQADARHVRETLMREAEAEARRLVEQTRKQLEDEKNKAAQALRKEITRLTLEVSERILRQPGVLKGQTSLVESLLNDIEKSGASR